MRRRSSNGKTLRVPGGAGALAGVALLLSFAGCALYEPRPVDWREEAARLGDAPACVTLSVAGVRARAAAFSPELNALRLSRATSEAKAEASGWWEDPSLEVDWLRILQSPEHPLVWGGSLTFSLPLSGIPGLERRAAAAYAEADRWALIAAERAAAGEAAVLAVTARELNAAGAAIGRFISSSNYLSACATAARLADAGEVERVDAEQLAADAREWTRTALELAHEQLAAESALRRTLLLSPACEIGWARETAPVAFPTNAYAPADFTNAPSVKAAVARLAGGEAELDREIRRQYPELSLGPAYSREEGFNRMGLTAGLTVPLWNRNRVGIAAARGARDEARSAAVEAWRDAVRAWHDLKQEATRLHAQDGLPRGTLENAERLYEAGELDAPGYVGAVHRYLTETVAAARLRIDRESLAERMKSIVEGMNVKGRDE